MHVSEALRAEQICCCCNRHPLTAQGDAARAGRAGARRIVLATPIAEASLTVAGVRAVVDAGLARRPEHDAGTGLSRLRTVRVSAAAADQRRGRAGAGRAAGQTRNTARLCMVVSASQSPAGPCCVSACSLVVSASPSPAAPCCVNTYRVEKKRLGRPAARRQGADAAAPQAGSGRACACGCGPSAPRCRPRRGRRSSTPTWRPWRWRWRSGRRARRRPGRCWARRLRA